MRIQEQNLVIRVLAAGVLALAVTGATDADALEAAPAARATIAQSLAVPPFPLSRIEQTLIEFPLPKGEEVYGAIDGKKMHRYVVELADISRKYRDAGHPRFWGRIIGTSGERDTEQWLASKFTAIGLTDVKVQAIDLVPQWFPKEWDAQMTADGRTINLTSAQPAYGAESLPAGGVELDAIYVGLGSDADFIGRDVKGKAVFIAEILGQDDETARLAIRRADAKGAAAIFASSMLPGNMRYQAYPSGTKAPQFALGNDDGNAIRDMIATAKTPPKVKVSLTTERVSNLHSSLVWGTLPGATDETIYVVAHKDGWFDASGDNGGGVASMLGLAEFFAKVPKEKRRRTIIFIGLDGHHNSGPGSNAGGAWLAQNKATLFAKTALFINNEHPATVQTQARPRYYPGDEIAWSNTYMPMEWYAGGKSRPELQKIVWDAFKTFGAPLLLDPNPTPPASDLGTFYRFTPGLDVSEYHIYFHTDWETPETVPWTGLQASTRAMAKVIDEVNKHPLSTFQRPEEPPPPPR